MAETGAEQSKETWPVPEFHFSVEISNVGKISCKEVSGLDVEFDVIEYRSGDMPGFTKVKMPGMRKSGDVTLKKAMFKDDKKLWDWLNRTHNYRNKPIFQHCTCFASAEANPSHFHSIAYRIIFLNNCWEKAEYNRHWNNNLLRQMQLLHGSNKFTDGGCFDCNVSHHNSRNKPH